MRKTYPLQSAGLWRTIPIAAVGGGATEANSMEVGYVPVGTQTATLRAGRSANGTLTLAYSGGRPAEPMRRTRRPCPRSLRALAAGRLRPRSSTARTGPQNKPSRPSRRPAGGRAAALREEQSVPTVVLRFVPLHGDRADEQEVLGDLALQVCMRLRVHMR